MAPSCVVDHCSQPQGTVPLPQSGAGGTKVTPSTLVTQNVIVSPADALSFPELITANPLASVTAEPSKAALPGTVQVPWTVSPATDPIAAGSSRSTVAVALMLLPFAVTSTVLATTVTSVATGGGTPPPPGARARSRCVGQQRRVRHV